MAEVVEVLVERNVFHEAASAWLVMAGRTAGSLERLCHELGEKRSFMGDKAGPGGQLAGVLSMEAVVFVAHSLCSVLATLHASATHAGVLGTANVREPKEKEGGKKTKKKKKRKKPA